MENNNAVEAKGAVNSTAPLRLTAILPEVGELKK
jgi:hypothetical protein